MSLGASVAAVWGRAALLSRMPTHSHHYHREKLRIDPGTGGWGQICTAAGLAL